MKKLFSLLLVTELLCCAGMCQRATFIAQNITAAPSVGAFVGSGRGTADATTLTNAITGTISIPAGDIIVIGTGNNATAGFLSSPTDSNGDTASCGTAVTNTVSSNYTAQLCVIKAGATITSITCNQTAGFTMNCAAEWRTPGPSTGVLDKSAGKASTSAAAWSSGNTAALTGSTDLVFDFWYGCCGLTSTYSDGSTQRIAGTGTYNYALTDRVASGTGAVAASGTWSSSSSGPTMVIAVK